MNNSKSETELERFLCVAQREGFARVLEISFVVNGMLESFHVMFHATDGILLVFDTFRMTQVNGGSFYYNWKPNGLHVRPLMVIMPNGYEREDGIWVGKHHRIDSLEFHLRKLRENGTFVTPWVEQPLLWMVHHGDGEVEGYQADLIARGRLALLPADVRAAILALDPIETA